MVAEGCIIWKCCRQNWITRSSWFHNLVLVTSSNPKEACTLAPSRKGWEYMRIFIMSIIYYLLQCNSILLDSNVKKKGGRCCIYMAPLSETSQRRFTVINIQKKYESKSLNQWLGYVGGKL